MIFPFFPLLDRPETHSSSKTAKLSLPYNPKTVPELIVRKCVSEPSCSDGHLVRIMGRRSVFACFTAFFDADLVRKMGILLCIEQVSYQCCFSCREKKTAWPLKGRWRSSVMMCIEKRFLDMLFSAWRRTMSFRTVYPARN